jgi:hypothetical protein
MQPLSEHISASLPVPALSAGACYNEEPQGWGHGDVDAMISKAIQNAIELASMAAAPPLPSGDNLVPSSIGIRDASCLLSRSLLFDSVIACLPPPCIDPLRHSPIPPHPLYPPPPPLPSPSPLLSIPAQPSKCRTRGFIHNGHINRQLAPPLFYEHDHGTAAQTAAACKNRAAACKNRAAACKNRAAACKNSNSHADAAFNVAGAVVVDPARHLVGCDTLLNSSADEILKFFVTHLNDASRKPSKTLLFHFASK